MKKNIAILAAVVLVIAVVIGFYLMQEETPEVKPEPPVKVSPPATVVPVEPVKPQPAPVISAPPLPLLKDSDPIMRETLSDLLGGGTLKKFFRSEDIVRHIVVTIDNLPRKTAAARMFPTKPVSGKFLTRGEEERLAIAPKNAARYTPYVRMAELVDTKRLVAIYLRLAPLFQRAYQDLGYPNGSFNDRLITVIDHLLGAPEINGATQLAQPNVMFEYANPSWEAQSAGRKIMMRMGRENEIKIKNKLRDFRNELASLLGQQVSAK